MQTTPQLHLVTLTCGGQTRTAWLTADEVAELRAFAAGLVLPLTTLNVNMVSDDFASVESEQWQTGRELRQVEVTL